MSNKRQLQDAIEQILNLDPGEAPNEYLRDKLELLRALLAWMRHQEIGDGNALSALTILTGLMIAVRATTPADLADGLARIYKSFAVCIGVVERTKQKVAKGGKQ